MCLKQKKSDLTKELVKNTALLFSSLDICLCILGNPESWVSFLTE